MAVRVFISDSPTVGTPERLFSAWSLGTGDARYRYDVTPDGRQFLLCENDAEYLGVQLIQNWFSEFEDRQAGP